MKLKIMEENEMRKYEEMNSKEKEKKEQRYLINLII